MESGTNKCLLLKGEKAADPVWKLKSSHNTHAQKSEA